MQSDPAGQLMIEDLHDWLAEQLTTHWAKPAGQAMDAKESHSWFWSQRMPQVEPMPVVQLPVQALAGHAPSPIGGGVTPQPTHWPSPLHCVPPCSAQGVPEGSGGLEGEPLVHTSSVHEVPSTGTSEFCASLDGLPEPSQKMAWQSPDCCASAGASSPCGTYSAPHVLLSHVLL
jgi:hypothetical protein